MSLSAANKITCLSVYIVIVQMALLKKCATTVSHCKQGSSYFKGPDINMYAQFVPFPHLYLMAHCYCPNSDIVVWLFLWTGSYNPQATGDL